MPARQPVPAASFEDDELISEAFFSAEIKILLTGSRQRVNAVLAFLQQAVIAKRAEFGEHDPDGRRTRAYLLSLFKLPAEDFDPRTPAREVAGVTARLIENTH